MTNPKPRQLDTYASMVTRISRMHELAAQGNWENFLEQDPRILTDLSTIQFIDENHLVDDSDRAQVLLVKSQYLDLMKKIHVLLMARREELGNLLEKAAVQEANGFLGSVVNTAIYGPNDFHRKRHR